MANSPPSSPNAPGGSPVIAVVGRSDISTAALAEMGIQAVHAIADHTDGNPAGDPALSGRLLEDLGRTIPLPQPASSERSDRSEHRHRLTATGCPVGDAINKEHIVDTRQLKYFIAVIDHRGFSRAAEHLQIAQPSLSQAIAGFERELGVPLFHRVGRGVVPTDAGDHLVAPARRVLRALDAARSTIDAVKGVTTGRVEIITTASPGVEPLATIVRSFTALHPDVTINITVADVPDDVMQAVRTGSSEIGLLGAARLPQPADLNVLPLQDQELVLVTAPGGSLTGRTRVTADDLTGRRLVVAQRGSLMRQFVDDMLAGGITVTVAADVAHRRSPILPLVLAGVADAVLPAGWTELARRAGADVLAIDPASHLRVALVHRKAPLTPAAVAFTAAAATHAQQHAPSPDRATADSLLTSVSQ